MEADAAPDDAGDHHYVLQRGGLVHNPRLSHATERASVALCLAASVLALLCG